MLSAADRAHRRMIGALASGGISDRTLQAIDRVRRDRLVVPVREPGGGVGTLFDADRAVGVKRGSGGEMVVTASAPRVLAAQADLLGVEAGMDVLEIGTGPGYFAALLAELVGPAGRVVTIEIDREVGRAAGRVLAAEGYDHIEVVVADADRWTPDRQFDRVVASVACHDLAPRWLGAVGPDGLLMAPLVHGDVHPTLLLGSDGSGRAVMRTSYVSIRGVQAEVTRPGDRPPAPRQRSGRRARALTATDEYDVALWDWFNQPGSSRDPTARDHSWSGAGCPTTFDWEFAFASEPSSDGWSWSRRRINHHQMARLGR